MRRFTLVLLASLALFGAACGGDDGNDASGDAKIDANASAKVDSDAVRTAAIAACDGREAVNFASTYTQALAGNGSDDYDNIAENLDKAADAAPSEIRTDFRVMADAVGPFIELFAEADGDFMSLAQDPKFQAAAEKVGSDEVQAASARVSEWFEEHCD